MALRALWSDITTACLTEKFESDRAAAHLAGPPTLSLRSCVHAAAMQRRPTSVRPVQQGIESSCKQEPALAIACATSSPA